MPGRLRPALGALALGLALVLGLAGRASAIEPLTVRVEGVVAVDDAAGSSRDRAFQEAMVEAVLEASRQLLPAEVLGLGSDEIRERLRPRAAEFVLTYRIDGPLRRQVSVEDGVTEQLVLPVIATVDAAQLRIHLSELGLLQQQSDRPSLALRVRSREDPAAGRSPAPLTGLESFLRDRLRDQGMVVVEPALRPPGSGSLASALELGRSLGTDVALDVSVAWRVRDTGSRVRGGVAEVQARAVRVQDGTEIALARFEGAGYHEVDEEAFARAIDAIREQVADNVLLQLDRNWQALAEDGGPVDVVLLDVSSLLQVSAVRRALQSTLGAQRADLVEMGPRTAALRVEGPFSPGALQDRLAGLDFQGFRLEPMRVEPARIELRVEPASEPETPDSPASGR